MGQPWQDASEGQQPVQGDQCQRPGCPCKAEGAGLPNLCPVPLGALPLSVLAEPGVWGSSRRPLPPGSAPGQGGPV